MCIYIWRKLYNHESKREFFRFQLGPNENSAGGKGGRRVLTEFRLPIVDKKIRVGRSGRENAIKVTCLPPPHPDPVVDDLSESHGPQESPLPDKRNRCSGYVQAGLNENRGHRLYIGFVKNRSPMKALTNHVVPSRSAQLLHFPMLFPSEFPARPSSSSSSSPFFSIRLPPCFHRCKNRSEIFPFPPETVLSAVCEGTGNTRINRIWTKLRASLIMHSTWELPHFYSMEMLRDPVIRVFSLSLSSLSMIFGIFFFIFFRQFQARNSY